MLPSEIPSEFDRRNSRKSYQLEAVDDTIESVFSHSKSHFVEGECGPSKVFVNALKDIDPAKNGMVTSIFSCFAC
jgi:hypothetical protein